jgi:aromatic-amino-acid transaminase
VVESYPYYDAATRRINFDGMLAALNAAPAGTIVVLHACCHNPTGYDITAAQWDQVIAVVKARNLTPFLDMAYQGFGHGIKEDGAVIGKFVAAGLEFFVSTSFLQELQPVRRARGRPERAVRQQGRRRPRAEPAQDRDPHQLQQPAHPRRRRGGRGAGQHPELRAQWEEELAEMRVRIKAMRQKLVDGLKAAGVKQDMSFITARSACSATRA